MLVVLTAVVGILNKYGVAIAADSAVTIGTGSDTKIFNKANKVFTLSKIHPVGIMIYNSATFMSTPWETIIKVYRKELGDNSFSTLDLYQQDFIHFLQKKEFYTDDDTQLLFLENFISEIVDSIINDVVEQNRQLINNPTSNSKSQFIAALEQRVDELIKYWSSNTDICVEFTNYTIDKFDESSKQPLSNIQQRLFNISGIQISVSLLSKIKQLAYLILKAKEEYTNFTGLVFIGFGDDEIYPQLIPINAN